MGCGQKIFQYLTNLRVSRVRLSRGTQAYASSASGSCAGRLRVYDYGFVPAYYIQNPAGE